MAKFQILQALAVVAPVMINQVEQKPSLLSRNIGERKLLGLKKIKPFQILKHKTFMLVYIVAKVTVAMPVFSENQQFHCVI